MELTKIYSELEKRYQKIEYCIDERVVTLFVIPQSDEKVALLGEETNTFECILYDEPKTKTDLKQVIEHKPSMEGYFPRLGVIFYKDKLIVIDYIRNIKLIKKIKKINKLFVKKIRNTIVNPSEDTFEKLFDKTDLIDEFWMLYRKTREFLIDKSRGITDELRRVEFVDNFMLTLLTLWYLQEKGFFNGDNNYLVTKFREYKAGRYPQFKSYWEFIQQLFDKINATIDAMYYDDTRNENIFGKVIIVGPAIFLNDNGLKQRVELPDECFYKLGYTELLINHEPKTFSSDIPLLNLFESREWTEGNIDEYALGAIYEKLITTEQRRKTGSYYTPPQITKYICDNTIIPYIIDQLKEHICKPHTQGQKKQSVNEATNKILTYLCDPQDGMIHSHNKINELQLLDEIIQNANEEILEVLFGTIKNLKILDPAAGSAHFLERAIEVLMDLYEKIWKRAIALNYRGNLFIYTVDNTRKLSQLYLIDISENNIEHFRLYVKFFIILSRNIYGVDISKNALNVARARLFLSLAKHFKSKKNNEVFIRFPNVHFNLRLGNSLVGYTLLRKDESDQTTQQASLEFWLSPNERQQVTEKIHITEELREYLNYISNQLRDGLKTRTIVKDISSLNMILSKRTLLWRDIKNVLKIKTCLTTILIVSLNSQYSRLLNDLLSKITRVFNKKLNEEYAKEYKISSNELLSLRAFHWILEFPEVFIENNGFDIVIGNPPYINNKSINKREKRILAETYASCQGQYDYFIPFIEQTIKLTNAEGHVGLIVSNKFLASEYGRAIRQLILEKVHLRKIVDVSHIPVFKGIGAYPIILLISKTPRFKEPIKICNISRLHELGSNKEINHISRELFRRITGKYIISTTVTQEIAPILEFLSSLPKLNEKIILCGIATTGFAKKIRSEMEIDGKKSNSLKQILQSEDIFPFHIKYQHKWISSEITTEKRWNDFNSKKVVIAAMGLRIRAAYETKKSALGRVYYIKKDLVLQTHKVHPKVLVCLLNSKVLNFFYKIIYSSVHQASGYLRFNAPYLGSLPIVPVPNEKLLITFHDILEHLHNTEDEKANNLVCYFEKLMNLIVYEIYLGKIFERSELAIELTKNLASLISSSVTQTKQLMDNAFLQKLVTTLQRDKSIKKEIEKIMSHPWVKMIDQIA